MEKWARQFEVVRDQERTFLISLLYLIQTEKVLRQYFPILSKNLVEVTLILQLLLIFMGPRRLGFGMSIQKLDILCNIN